MAEDDDDDLPASLIPESTQIAPGTEIIGTYVIEQHLNTGGMGEVYRGHNIHTEEPVAIKIVLPALAHDRKIISLFQKEATVLNRLNHEAIVRYQIFTVDPGIKRPCLVMEFVGGESLADHLRRGPMPPAQVFTLLARVASGLGAAHKVGVIHRDLSPDNVILQDGAVEHAKIIDFGIAKAANVGKGRTLIGDAFAGKFGFVAPEQLGKYGREVTERTDIYSLGLVAAAAAKGEAFDMGDDFFEALEARNAVPNLLGIDPGVAAVLERMLQPDPKDRPADMAEVLALLPGADGQTRPPRTAPPIVLPVAEASAPPAASPAATDPPGGSPPPVAAPPATKPPATEAPSTSGPGGVPLREQTRVSELPASREGMPPKGSARSTEISAPPGGGFEPTRITTDAPRVQPAPRAPEPTQLSEPPTGASVSTHPSSVPPSSVPPSSTSPDGAPSTTQIWSEAAGPAGEPPSSVPRSVPPQSQPPQSHPSQSQLPRSHPPEAERTVIGEAPATAPSVAPVSRAPERTQIATSPPGGAAELSPDGATPGDSDSPFGPPPSATSTSPPPAAPASQPTAAAAPAAPAATKQGSKTGVLIGGGVAALVVLGAGAWFGGLIPQGAPAVSGQGTEVASSVPAPTPAPKIAPPVRSGGTAGNDAAPAPAPKPAAPVVLPGPLVQPEGLVRVDLARAAPAVADPAAQRGALLAGFDALGCAYAQKGGQGGPILAYAAAGRDVAALSWAIDRTGGAGAPSVSARMVTPAQCPVLALVAARAGAAPLTIGLPAATLKPGQPFSGRITGAGKGPLSLYAIDAAGGVYDLSKRLGPAEGGARSFEVTLQAGAGAGAGQPLLFLAAAIGPGAAPDDAPEDAQGLSARLKSALAAPGGTGTPVIGLQMVTLGTP
ncbi:serine/threonine protein kinase [Acidimangrovimonas sediminis]|uniref:serine/threonine protein kinase n=1 Tax=Acidimangrovimonas sediminis TaxID=2056283 RepID=UPI000C7FAB95|nr:serine/threonine protein kinase [Acidimangrovimonas sediminis]